MKRLEILLGSAFSPTQLIIFLCALAFLIRAPFNCQAADAPVLVGEVSLVNDDLNDNIFTVPLPRFPEIIEDEPPLHLLCADYDRVLGLN